MSKSKHESCSKPANKQVGARRGNADGISKQNLDKVEKNVDNHAVIKSDIVSEVITSAIISNIDKAAAEFETIAENYKNERANKQEEQKDITEDSRSGRSGKRVTEERGALKRISGAFPQDLFTEIQARSDATGSSLSKAVVDLVGERVRAEAGELDTVMLNLPADLSPELRRSLEAMAQTMRDLVAEHDEPSL